MRVWVPTPGDGVYAVVARGLAWSPVRPPEWPYGTYPRRDAGCNMAGHARPVVLRGLPAAGSPWGAALSDVVRLGAVLGHW